MNMTAAQWWAKLEGERSTKLDKMRRYASLTLSHLLLPEGTIPDQNDITQDYQSLGATCVNHLTNKMMLAMFAPSRPIFRLQFSQEAMNEYLQSGLSQSDIDDAAAAGERESQRSLDSKGQRPKLYQLIKNLIVTGNVLMVLTKDAIRAVGIEHYCVKRDREGKIKVLVVRERICFDELDDEVQAAVGGMNRYSPDSIVSYYEMICRKGKMYYKSCWVDSYHVGEEYDEQWGSEQECPYKALTWELPDYANYGVGLVEMHANDFEALSILSESLVDGGVLAAEFRYLINATSTLTVDDLNKSQNGDTLTGNEGDVSVLQASTSQAVQIVFNISERWEQRLARTFLLQSAVTRNAERVTAEEIRATANELETALGGTYSMLSSTLQYAIAVWLLATIDIKIKGKSTDKIQVQIITGLDALSRNGDLEAIRGALQDLAILSQLPEAAQARLRMDELISSIGQGWGTDLKRFVRTDKEMQEQQAMMTQQNAMDAGAQAGAVAQAEQGAM